jgi:hypothetical protein
MSRFTDPVWLEPFGDDDWIVRRESAWEVGHVGSREFVVIPEGFVSDLASVPNLLRWLIPSYGRHTQAAVLHDRLYRHDDHDYTRSQSDRMFYEAMLALGVWKPRAWIMWLAVRVGGRWAWRG